jgi:glucose-6-phosphate isomerase
MANLSSSWSRFQKLSSRYLDLGFSVDFSRMNFADDFFNKPDSEISLLCQKIKALEAGEIANADENRMVGHYWLRNPSLAPTPDLQEEINAALSQVKTFAHQIHSSQIKAQNGSSFTHVLIVGIGGSALGPQLVADSITPLPPKLAIEFLDNTDPDGIDRVITKLGSALATTLTLVISKSGGTKETRNGMLEIMAAYQKANLDFSKHAVAITGEGSQLDQVAVKGQWLTRFPMWDWVGGRTSVMSTVGLVPAALQGVDIDSFLAGASAMDTKTRTTSLKENVALQLAYAWHHAGSGKGLKDMVILPYKDRLVLFSKYLQQLVMESLGKEHDLNGNTVNQGIAVYGNKGSTDQHAYVQQLRDGVNNFFATFIEVRSSRAGASMQVDPDITSGDYLQGFLRGTRAALAEKGRESITISIHEVNAFTLGLLIALYERAVSFYALIVNINAYHQPGVEAGKIAAESFLKNLKAVEAALTSTAQNAESIATSLNLDTETTWHILNHLAANQRAKISQGDCLSNDTFSKA